MLNKEVANEELLQEWKESRPDYLEFARDGILRLKCFEAQTPKILFLLKEPNADFLNIAPLKENSNGHGPNGNSKTFWRFMRGYEHVIHIVWNKAEYNSEEVLKIKEQPNINTAYVNVKKKCENNPRSDDREIIKFANDDQCFLLKQIAIIDPDVIFCAGTFKAYKVLDSNVRKLSNRVYESNGRIVLDFYHLAHRQGYKTFKKLYDLLSPVNFSDIRRS